jgi:hypothetical protein
MSIWYVGSIVFSLVGWVVYVNAVRKSNDIRNKDLCVIVFWLLCCFVPLLNLMGVLGFFVYYMCRVLDWLYDNKTFRTWLNQIAIPTKE